MKVPLKVLIAASNELPAKGEGLEALYDRFLIRQFVGCIEQEFAFDRMIASTKDTETEYTGETADRTGRILQNAGGGRDSAPAIQVVDTFYHRIEG